jgi:hypothetical protein
VRRGGIEPPPALQLGSESLGLSADSRMGGDSATRLRSNAAPHHTLYFLIELIIISTPSIAETLSTPPIEAATDAITVTLAPKLTYEDIPNIASNMGQELSLLLSARGTRPVTIASQTGRVRIPTLTSQNQNEVGIGLFRRR